MPAKFSEQVSANVAKTKLFALNVFRDSCRQVSFDIAEGTPVSTGRLLGKWSPAVNSVEDFSYQGGKSAWNHGKKNESIASINEKAALANLLPRIDSTTKRLTLIDKYYFTNSTEYVQQAEHEGWEKIGPYHMTYNAVVNWLSIVEYVMDRYKS